ncbi:MAG: metal-dependent hydrolase [Myxococcales bacterium]|nr:metal-dependent hydrolase [Myxococcales bacterium]
MTTLKVRNIPFDFSGEVPFLWNPEVPAFSLTANAIGVIAIAFEKYIVQVIKQAKAQITDPAVAAEADAFLRQEAQHARVHRLHMKALARRYPGLKDTVDRAVALFDELLAERSLKYHLAYIADLEASFTPTFKLMLDNEEQLFRPGDERVASMFLWHFVEEVEHRSSALLIYRGLGGGEVYRFAVLPSVVRHMGRVLEVIAEGFNAHVPVEDREVDARLLLPGFRVRRSLRALLPSRRGEGDEAPLPDGLGAVPSKDRRAASWRILLSQVPNHDPEHQPLPAFAAEWLERHARGEDVLRWYSSRRAG